MFVVGELRSNVPTPALCLDLSRFESNLAEIVRIVKASGKRWRPHVSCHRSPSIAQIQLAQGATGLTCATVTEAELFAAAGARSILLAHSIVGSDRTRRLAGLCHDLELIVSCDHYVQADQLSSECFRQGTICRVLVEVNVGMDRTGVRPGHDTLELARGIERLPGLKLAGFTGYAGHAMAIPNVDERQQCIEAAHGILAQTRDQFQQNGLCCDIISAGASGSLFAAINCDALTEVQAGTAVFGDVTDSKMPLIKDLKPALTLLATVISRPAYNRAVLDAGLTAFTTGNGSVVIKNIPDATVSRISAEHTVLQLGPESLELRIGDRVELIVGNPPVTTRFHEQYLCFRQDRLEQIWPIKTRDTIA